MRTAMGALAFVLLASSLAAQSREPKAFIGLTIGPSIPIGSFADKSANYPAGGHAELGYTDTFINFGYRLRERLGVAASAYYGEFNADLGGGDDWWQVSGLTVGPMHSRALSSRLFLDLKAKAGMLATVQVIDSYEAAKGVGFTADLRAGFRHNVARRWSLIAEGGLVSGFQSFSDGTNGGVHAIISGFGLAYRPSWGLAR